jgi:hypothetical protein
MQLIMYSMSQRNESFKIRHLEDSRCMELCVQVVNGYLLAFELLAQDFCRQRESPRRYFCRLVTFQPMAFDEEWISHQPGTQLITKLRSIIRESEESFPLLFKQLDLKYLAPFWQVFPSNLAVYFELLERSFSRISLNVVVDPRISEGIRAKPTAESMSNEEEKGMVNGIFQDPQSALGIFLEIGLAIILQPIQHNGFIERSKQSFHEPQGNNDNITYEYYSIHPVLTLILRSMLDRLPKRSAYAIAVAFQRFHINHTQY